MGAIEEQAVSFRVIIERTIDVQRLPKSKFSKKLEHNRQLYRLFLFIKIILSTFGVVILFLNKLQKGELGGFGLSNSRSFFLNPVLLWDLVIKNSSCNPLRATHLSPKEFQGI